MFEGYQTNSICILSHIVPTWNLAMLLWLQNCFLINTQLLKRFPMKINQRRNCNYETWFLYSQYSDFTIKAVICLYFKILITIISLNKWQRLSWTKELKNNWGLNFCLIPNPLMWNESREKNDEETRRREGEQGIITSCVERNHSKVRKCFHKAQYYFHKAHRISRDIKHNIF